MDIDPSLEAALLAQLAHLDPAEARAIVDLANKYGPIAFDLLKALLVRFHVSAK